MCEVVYYKSNHARAFLSVEWREKDRRHEHFFFFFLFFLWYRDRRLLLTERKGEAPRKVKQRTNSALERNRECEQ